MIKQLKAEVFRMVNSGEMRFGNGVYYLGVLLALLCLFPFSEDWGRLNEPLSAALGYFVQESYIIFCNRICHYLVMICIESGVYNDACPGHCTRTCRCLSVFWGRTDHSVCNTSKHQCRKRYCKLYLLFVSKSAVF